MCAPISKCASTMVSTNCVLCRRSRPDRRFAQSSPRKRLSCARLRTNVLVLILIRAQIIPRQQNELVHVAWPQPPMIGFTLRVQAVIAFVWAANLHALVLLIPGTSRAVESPLQSSML